MTELLKNPLFENPLYVGLHLVIPKIFAKISEKIGRKLGYLDHIDGANELFVKIQNKYNFTNEILFRSIFYMVRYVWFGNLKNQKIEKWWHIVLTCLFTSAEMNKINVDVVDFLNEIKNDELIEKYNIDLFDHLIIHDNIDVFLFPDYATISEENMSNFVNKMWDLSCKLSENNQINCEDTVNYMFSLIIEI